MIARIFFGVAGAGLLAVFLGPVVVKLNDAALWTVVAVGFALMLADLWQSLRSQKD